MRDTITFDRRRRDQFSRMHLGDLLHFIGQRDKAWIEAMRVLAERHARDLEQDEHLPHSAA